MSVSKFRSPIARPRRADGTLLPAACAAVLAAAAIAQLMLTGELALPAAGAVGRAASPALPVMRVDQLPPILAERAIFAPTQGGGGGGGEGDGAAPATGPLGGARVAGAIIVRGRPMIMIQRPDGSIVRLARGGSFEGWRFQRVADGAAIFRQGSARIMVPFGAPAPVEMAESPETEEAQ
jgi:hypothetical protein